MLSTPDCLSCTLAVLAELAELAELLEPLEPQAVIRTAALAAISGMVRILFRTMNSLRVWSSLTRVKGRAGYSAVESIQRYDGAVLSDNVIHMAALGEGLPGRLAKFLYMSDEQI